MVAELAHQAVGTATTPAAQAQALVNWFRSGQFRYTLSPPPTERLRPVGPVPDRDQGRLLRAVRRRLRRAGPHPRDPDPPGRRLHRRPGRAGRDVHGDRGGRPRLAPGVSRARAPVGCRSSPPHPRAPARRQPKAWSGRTVSSGSQSTTPTTVVAGTAHGTGHDPGATRPDQQNSQPTSRQSAPSRAPGRGFAWWAARAVAWSPCSCSPAWPSGPGAAAARSARPLSDPTSGWCGPGNAPLVALRRRGLSRRPEETPAEYRARVRRAEERATRRSRRVPWPTWPDWSSWRATRPGPCTPTQAAHAHALASTIVAANRSHRRRGRRQDDTGLKKRAPLRERALFRCVLWPGLEAHRAARSDAAVALQRRREPDDRGREGEPRGPDHRRHRPEEAGMSRSPPASWRSLSRPSWWS